MINCLTQRRQLKYQGNRQGVVEMARMRTTMCTRASSVGAHIYLSEPRVVDFSRRSRCSQISPRDEHDDACCPARLIPRLSIDEAMDGPAPRALTCGGCGRRVSAEPLKAGARVAWRDDWTYSCAACGWHGRLVARNIGQLLTLFECRTVQEVGWGLADRVDGSEESWIEFIEETQSYVFGYWILEAELTFPADPKDMMNLIEFFDDSFLESIEPLEEDAECTCE